MTSFYTTEELASDTYRMLVGAKSLREFIVVAASILGDLCDELLPLGSVAECEDARFQDYISLCDWICEQPANPRVKEYLTYYWDRAANIFHDYERNLTMDDWELYLEIIDPHDPDWDETVDDKEQYVRDRIIETCFAITRLVKGSSAKCLSREA
jgi:hypothetical protein